MSHIRLRCTSCGRTHAADMATLACRDCGAPLEVEYQDPGGVDADRRGPGRARRSAPTPLHRPENGVSLGQGNTPLVPLPHVGELLGLERLHAKLEFMSPTGSFKDRGSAVLLSVAGEQGVRELVEDSSGNAGASIAAYSARAGVRAHIFAPASAPAAKVRQIKAYGAEMHAIEGPREAAATAAASFCSEHGLVYASHALSPYFLEGTKTFAYEVIEQLGGEAPDHMVFPVGNGSLFLGTWKGLQELRRAGATSVMPRLHAVQSRAVMPLVAAYRGERWSPADATRTAAGGIAVATPVRGRQMLDTLAATGGAAVAVGEPDILRWRALLAEREGVFAEPTSAAVFAGVERLVAMGVIERSQAVLVPITGLGLKDDSPA